MVQMKNYYLNGPGQDTDNTMASVTEQDSKSVVQMKRPGQEEALETEQDTGNTMAMDGGLDTDGMLNCTLCAKKFKTKKKLYNHKSKVHRKREAACIKCNVSFKTNYHLKSHYMSYKCMRANQNENSI